MVCEPQETRHLIILINSSEELLVVYLLRVGSWVKIRFMEFEARLLRDRLESGRLDILGVRLGISNEGFSFLHYYNRGEAC